MIEDRPLVGYVARLLLGRRLRHLREARNLHFEDAAVQVGMARATLWRMEKGDVRCRCKPGDVERLAQLYAADEQATAPLLELAEGARGHSWVTVFRGLLPEVVEAYTDLEGYASRIRCYASTAIPELLQTEEYAKAMIAASGDLSEVDVRTQTYIRLKRQAVVYGRNSAVELSFVLDEAVYNRHDEKPDMMLGQVRRIIECADLPNVTIQLMPFRAGVYPGLDAGSFSILDFPQNDEYGSPPTTVYVNRLGEQLLLNKPTEVEAYEACWTEIQSRALDKPASQETRQPRM